LPQQDVIHPVPLLEDIGMVCRTEEQLNRGVDTAMGEMDNAVFRCPVLHREVTSFVLERELSLIQDLSLAVELAPDVDRGLAALTLIEARRAQLVRLAFAGGTEVPPVPARADRSDWPAVANHLTVGATLGKLFFSALHDMLVDERILALEVLVRNDPETPEVIWAEALAHQDRVPEAVYKVVNGGTQALLARPALTASIGHDGTLALFAATFDSLPTVLKGPGGP
jgi:hypothetical protein